VGKYRWEARLTSRRLRNAWEDITEAAGCPALVINPFLPRRSLPGSTAAALFEPRSNQV
jgi:hypothetical protein